LLALVRIHFRWKGAHRLTDFKPVGTAGEPGAY
jgi:hypothetical protein